MIKGQDSKHRTAGANRAAHLPGVPGGKVRYGSMPKPWWEEEDALCLREDAAGNGGMERVFDLEERTARFGENIVRFARTIPHHSVNERLISQIVGAGTSIGANYAEASEAVSKKDFRFPISRYKKEAKETKFFLRMIVASEPQLAETARPLYREAHELHMIFAAIYRKKP